MLLIFLPLILFHLKMSHFLWGKKPEPREMEGLPKKWPWDKAGNQALLATRPSATVSYLAKTWEIFMDILNVLFALNEDTFFCF